MGWSPSADSIIHAALISRATAEAVASGEAGSSDLRCAAVSCSCQIDDSSIRVTCKAFNSPDDANSQNDCLHYVSPAGQTYEHRKEEVLRSVPAPPANDQHAFLLSNWASQAPQP